MIRSKMDDQYSIEFNIRPIRIAYFIKEDDIDNFIRIIRFTCTQWGGIRHLIIPIKNDGGMPNLFVKILVRNEPDMFIHYLLPEEDSSLCTSLLTKIKEVFPKKNIELMNGEEFESVDHTAHAMGVIDSKILEGKIFTDYIIPEDVDTFSKAIILSLYGQVYLDQDDYYPSLRREVKDNIVFNSKTFWEDQLVTDHFFSILNVTAFGFTTYVSGDFFSPNYFDIVVVDSVLTLCLYWNWRSIRESCELFDTKIRKTLLLPKALLDNKVMIDHFLNTVRGKSYHPSKSSNVDLNFVTWDQESHDKVEAIFSRYPNTEKQEKLSLEITFGAIESKPRLDTDLIRYSISSAMRYGGFREGIVPRNPTFTTLKEGSNNILFQPPATYHKKFHDFVALDISCDVFNRYPEIENVAGKLISNSWFSRYGLSMMMAVAPRSHYMPMNIPDEWVGINSFFNKKGYQINESKVSSYSDALINLIGGIEAVEVLASPASYYILDILALKSTLKIAQRVEKAIGNTTGDLQEILYQISPESLAELRGVTKTYSQLTFEAKLQSYKKDLLSIIDSMVKKQILKRGFFLECPRCSNAEWYPLHNINEVLTCPGCIYDFILPAQTTTGTELQLHYRLNTLVNRAMDQALLPGILALYTLTKGKKAFCMTLGLEIKNNERVVTDLDFLFLFNRQFYAGECKTGTKLGEKDIRTAQISAEIGIKTFYFCTIQAFDEETLEKIEQLRLSLDSSGFSMRIEVVSGQDLLGEILRLS